MSHRVRTLLRYLDYESVSKKFFPKKKPFTGIKKGGTFPKIAKVIGYPQFGLMMEELMMWSLDYCDDGIQKRIQEYLGNFGITDEKYTKIDQYQDYIQLFRIEIGGLNIEKEPEWTVGNVQGHPDFVSEDCIYEMKTTGDFGSMRTTTILQMLCYYCLSQKLAPGKYNSIALILPAQKSVIKLTMGDCDVEWFWNMLSAAPFQEEERSLRYTINPIEYIKFEYQRRSYCGHTVHKPTLFQALPHRFPVQFFVAGRSSGNVDVPEAFRKKLKKQIQLHFGRAYVHSPYCLNPSSRERRSSDVKGVCWTSGQIGKLLEFGEESQAD